MDSKMKFRKFTHLFCLLILGFGILITISCKKNTEPDPVKTAKIINIVNKLGDSLTTKLKMVGHPEIDMNVPGAVIAFWSDELNFNYVKSFGISDVNTKEPMQVNNLFRIGSITKTFVITVFLQLVDEKKVSLDDKLSKFYPDFQRSGEITLRQLCNMSSGIFNFWEDENYVKWMIYTPQKPATPWDIITLVKDRPFYFSPGGGMHYSNTNTFLIGLIIEKLTGNKIEAEINNRIITKLKLTNTFFPDTRFFPTGFSYSKGYENSDTKIKNDFSDYLDPSLTWTAGVMISNIEDLKIWIRACAGGTLLSNITQAERIKTIPFDAAKMDYGLGIMGYKGFWGHGGDILGYHTIILHSPERKTTIAVMLNCSADQIQTIKDIIDCYLSLPVSK